MLKNNVKNILIAGLTSGLLMIGSTCFATNTGIINTETVKLRAEASTESKVVTLVSQDEKVEIIEEKGQWYKVKYNGKTGYIFAQYVDSSEKKEENTDNENAAEANETVAEESETKTQTSENVAEESENEQTNLEISSNVVFSQDIQIRLVPLINSSDISTIPANTQAVVLDYINGWYYITTGTTSGWIREEKLPTQSEVKKEAQEESKEEETNIIKYTSEKVNLRKSASSDGEIIKTISKNTKVTVNGTEGDWSKVTVNGETGYISSKYLSDKEVEENSNSTNTTNRGTEKTRTEANTESLAATDIVSYAKTYLGTKYVSGGESPSKGFDCSGFTRYIYKKYGVNLPHSASAQASVGTEVSKSNLQPGDLVIFKGESGNSVGHVGIYIGGNQFIHASNPSDGVKITSMSTGYYSSRYVTARRVI